MEQPTLIPEKCFVRDLRDGQEVDSIFVVRARSRRQKRNGESFLKLQLGDVSGSIEAVVWDEVDALAPVCESGAIVRVLGTMSVDDRYGAALTVRRMRAAREGEYDPADLIEGSPIPYPQMAADLDALVQTVQRPHLRELLVAPDRSRLRHGPGLPRGAGGQVLPPGLPPRAARALPLGGAGRERAGRHLPGLDRDVAVTGALLHDIGKIEAYASRNGAIELSDAGKLQGEIPLGYYRCAARSSASTGFPATDAEAVLHIVLSHHGKLEHGSPVVPCTREATLVHMIDNLGGTLGSFDRIEKTLADGASWSDFDRGLSTSAYFGRREPADGREAA